MGQVWGYELGINDDLDQVRGYRDYELWRIRIIMVMVYYNYMWIGLCELYVVGVSGQELQ